MIITILLGFITFLRLAIYTTIRNILGGAESKMLCLFLSDYIPQDYFASSSADKQWKIITTPPRNNRVDFMYADGDHLRLHNYNRLHAKLKPRLDACILFDKTRLVSCLSLAAPHTICKTITTYQDTKIPPGAVWIVKSNIGEQGLTNVIVTNQAEYDAAYKKLIDINKHSVIRSSRESTVSASEYIADPMLYHGFKFHIRIFIIVLIKANGEKLVWVMNEGYIAPAKKLYVAGNYDDADIHDSHFTKQPKLMGKYPRDLPGVSINTVHMMLKDALSALIPSVNKYPEAVNGYDLYGADVMITRLGTPKLLEINQFPSYLRGRSFSVAPFNTDEIAYKVFDGIMATAFSEVFYPCGDSSLVTRLI